MPLPNINPMPNLPSRPSPKPEGNSFQLPSHNKASGPQRIGPEPAGKSSFIFGDKSALGRRAMKYKLRVPDKKALMAERQAGLSMNRDERAALVNKYFPGRLGRTITEDEFRRQIKISERKTIADPGLRKQHLREMEYLKKLGGLK